MLAVKRDKNQTDEVLQVSGEHLKLHGCLDDCLLKTVSSLTNQHREDKKDLLYSDSLSLNFWPL